MKSKLQITTIALVILCAMLTSPTFGQDLVFHEVINSEGGNFNFVTGITQDANGVMWFATKRGIYSYDGTQMKSYKNSTINPNSLISNFSEAIYADSNGIIWVGSLGDGLDKFDSGTGIFTHYHHISDDKTSISNDTVTVILKDSEGMLWIGTHGGLNKFDPKTEQFVRYQNTENDSTSISDNQVRSIYEDKKGNLWVGTGSPYLGDGGTMETGGLNLLDKKTGKFTRYLHNKNDKNSLSNNKIRSIYEDDKGVLWIGTGGPGLHTMNTETGTFERLVFDPANPGKLSAPPFNPVTNDYEHITFFIQDVTGSYWYGTVESGLFYYNPKIGKITNYKGPDSNTGFNDVGAWSAYNSRDGILWIGTTQGYIYRINPLQKEIPHFNVDGGPANCFYEESDGTFWIGTNQGLVQQDKKTGTSKQILIDSNPASPKNNINFLYGDNQNVMWVGTMDGLAVYDKKNQKFTRYSNAPENINSISNNTIWAIHEDNQSNLWVGTSYGLNKLNRETGNFTRYFNDVNSGNIFTAIYEDKTGKLWLGNWNGFGIQLFNKETGKFKNYLNGVNVTSFFEDSNKDLWVGINQGLLKYDRIADKFNMFSDINSITVMSNITGIKEDNQNYLWIGCAEGIIRINPERNNSRIFGQEYGV
ncbi:MAG TPA: two-component regulator propeller domain-containing protein, partial [Draconibacterium sp.]|nr:two-component regulator propeller domain-containing protein [Draconibacterium sp.]